MDETAKDLERLRELSKQAKKLDEYDEAQAKINAEFFELCVELVPILLEELDVMMRRL